MSLLWHFLRFDARQARMVLIPWWLFCSVPLGLGVFSMLKPGDALLWDILFHWAWMPMLGLEWLLVMLAVGMLVQRIRPGEARGFLTARPIPADFLFKARILGFALWLLLPCYLGRLVFLCVWGGDLGDVGLWTLRFWSFYLAMIACFASLAAGTRSHSAYMMTIILTVVGIFTTMQLILVWLDLFNLRGGGRIGMLLHLANAMVWNVTLTSGISVLAAAVVFVGMWKGYLGRRSWLWTLIPVGAAVTLLSLGQTPFFTEKPPSPIREIDPGFVDEGQVGVEFTKANQGFTANFVRRGSTSTYSSGDEPPWEHSAPDQVWYREGQFAVSGIPAGLILGGVVVEGFWEWGTESWLYQPARLDGYVDSQDIFWQNWAQPRAVAGRLAVGSDSADPQILRTTIFGAPASVIEKSNTSAGTYRMRLRLDISEFQVLLDSTVQPGSLARSGLWHRRVESESGNAIVTRVLRPVDWLASRHAQGDRRGRTFLKVYDEMLRSRGEGNQTGSQILGLFVPQTQTWTFNLENLEATSSKQKRLMWVVPEYRGSLERELVVEPFTLINP